MHWRHFVYVLLMTYPEKETRNKEQGTTVDSSHSSFNHSNLSVHSVSQRSTINSFHIFLCNKHIHTYIHINVVLVISVLFSFFNYYEILMFSLKWKEGRGWFVHDTNLPTNIKKNDNNKKKGEMFLVVWYPFSIMMFGTH